MSSGSILLQQLRSRQSKSSSNNKSSSDGKNEKSGIITSSCDGTAVNPPVAAISQRKISLPIATKKKQVIEVCLGPDCAVAGGGAALLEIEDLVRPQQCNKDSHNDDTKILVQPGGCRDHCTEGPNVRLISCNGGGGVDADFHKVNNPEACRRVVNSLFPTESTPTNNELHAAGHSMRSATAATNSNEHDDSNETSSSSDNVVVARLLLRKEDAKRWKAHRERAAKERRLQAISRSQGT
mmetsp:Transcript_30111/g.51228  ORF Transcript_30111/g.51228 Transcript_30111/m.51228 type:complete len:239 (-) Transcript_30111:213-929(-)